VFRDYDDQNGKTLSQPGFNETAFLLDAESHDGSRGPGGKKRRTRTRFRLIEMAAFTSTKPQLQDVFHLSREPLVFFILAK
jgi:hypothetical protein